MFCLFPARNAFVRRFSNCKGKTIRVFKCNQRNCKTRYIFLSRQFASPIVCTRLVLRNRLKPVVNMAASRPHSARTFPFNYFNLLPARELNIIPVCLFIVASNRSALILRKFLSNYAAYIYIYIYNIWTSIALLPRSVALRNSTYVSRTTKIHDLSRIDGIRGPRCGRDAVPALCVEHVVPFWPRPARKTDICQNRHAAAPLMKIEPKPRPKIRNWISRRSLRGRAIPPFARLLPMERYAK